MIKIGLMLDNIGPNQLAHYLIQTGNSFLEKNSQRADLVAFTQQTIHPIATPNFATMNISEAYDYNGFLVATNLQTAIKMLKCPGTRRKFFYVWDLEWTRPQNKNFAILKEIYNNPKIELISRSANHDKLIELCWRKPIGLVEDARVDQFYSLFEKVS
jgi:hypothetical protein